MKFLSYYKIESNTKKRKLKKKTEKKRVIHCQILCKMARAGKLVETLCDIGQRGQNPIIICSTMIVRIVSMKVYFSQRNLKFEFDFL